jgi:hypothetical protein
VLGARDPEPYLPVLRRLARSGYAVRHIAIGDDREAFRAVASMAGLDAGTADLSPGWRDADALVLAG